MPARKEYMPEFKDQAVRFGREEIGPYGCVKQGCGNQSAPAKHRGAVSPVSVGELP